MAKNEQLDIFSLGIDSVDTGFDFAKVCAQ